MSVLLVEFNSGGGILIYCESHHESVKAFDLRSSYISGQLQPSDLFVAKREWIVNESLSRVGDNGFVLVGGVLASCIPLRHSFCLAFLLRMKSRTL